METLWLPRYFVGFVLVLLVAVSNCISGELLQGPSRPRILSPLRKALSATLTTTILIPLIENLSKRNDTCIRIVDEKFCQPFIPMNRGGVYHS